MLLRTLLVLQVCTLAGCYDGDRQLEQRDPSRRRVHDSGEHETPAGALEAGVATAPDARDADIDADVEVEAGANSDTRWILVDEVTNARDLGGVALGKGNVVDHGALFRGPPLSALGSSGCDEFARLGTRTVVDLRIETERTSAPEDDCVQRSANIVFAPLPVPYNVSPSDYVADLNATDSISAVFRVLGDEAAYPVYFHCTWGRDRTGVLAAVILRALGATRSNIMQEYQLSGPIVGAYPDSLAAVLDAIDAGGGIAAYLASAGVTSAQLTALRARAIRSVERSD